MALVQTTLASELQSLEPTGVEADAIANLAGAWENYFAGAAVLGIPPTAGSLAGATTAMKGGNTGRNPGVLGRGRWGGGVDLAHGAPAVGCYPASGACRDRGCLGSCVPKQRHRGAVAG